MTPRIPRQTRYGRDYATRLVRQFGSESRLALAVFLVTVAVFQAASAGLADEPLWTAGVRRVDRERQGLVRLPDRPQASLKAKAARGSFRVRGFFRIHDSVSFSFKGRHYRLAHVNPIPNAQICLHKDGTRWPCGLEARAALETLLVAIGTVCVQTATTTDLALVACRAGDHDIAALQVARGYAIADRGTLDRGQ